MLFFPSPLSAYLLFTAAAANFLLGIFLLRRSRGNAANIIFELSSFCLAIWCAGTGLLAAPLDPATRALGAKVAFFGAAPIPYLLFLLSTVFPNSKLKFSPATVLLLALPTFILLLFIPGSYVLDPIPMRDGIMLHLASLSLLYTAHFIVYFVLAAIVFYYRYDRSTGQERVRYNYFFLGVSIASLIGFTCNLLFVHILKYTGLVYFGPLGTVPLVALTTYAVVKYRIMDITFILLKTTAYSLVTFGITFTYVLVVIGCEFIFRLFYGSYSFWGSIPAAFVIAVTFVPVREQLQRLTDELFFRQTIEYQQVIREVTRLMASVTDLKTLFRLVDRTIARVMCLKSACVLLFETQTNCYLVEKINGLPEQFSRTKLALDDPLIVYLNEQRDAVALDDLRARLNGQLMEPAQREQLQAVADQIAGLEAEVIFPAFAKQKLVGLLSLGEKLSGEPYSPEDLSLLSSMASEAAIAIENSKLYRDITATRDYLKSLIQGSGDAILTLDLSGRVTGWNAGATALFNRAAAVALGQLPPFLSETELKTVVSRVVAGETIKALQLHDLLLTLSPIRDADNLVVGVSAIIKDISELKKADQAKSEFLAAVSHDLNTPLTPIIGYASLLLTDPVIAANPKRQEALAIILNQSHHLSSLIEVLIDLSRIEAGKPIRLEKEPLFIDRLVRESILAERPALAAKGLHLSEEYPINKMVIMGDKKKLLKVLNNLLGNARKFSPRGTSVTIKVEQTDHQVAISIIDQGIGLAPENLGKVFNKFFQVDAAYTSAAGGIGIGLTVAREIVETHGGRLRVSSPGLGQGATFTFNLPVESQ